uniref:E3 ubiquitin-protein ligase n=1 Tax=Romanomermis culicivorax TaxID=13658 RepID=A0A915HDQ8_ROMCU
MNSFRLFSNLCPRNGPKPIGYYVRRAGGLFPAPYPQNCPQLEQVCKLFRFMGTFIAKVLQDGRLVDLPLSKSFLKFLCQSSDYSLNFRDFELLYPIKARFLQQLKKLCDKRREISSDKNLTAKEQRQKLDKLRLSVNGCDIVDCDEAGSYQVEDLGLTFQLNPPSQVCGYEYVDLIENGGSISVQNQNLNDYVELCTDFYLNSGIKLQLQAFKNGFDRVFPMDRLRSFSPEEVQTLISGEQYPRWTAEDIIAHTEPKLGYSKDSPGFLRFVEVLCEMTGEERKSFLQFTTGCSSLPPVDGSDGSYPSVNTCVHYLKLPEYTSKEILKKRLLGAMREKGFHLN